jgi:hypothetical protein
MRHFGLKDAHANQSKQCSLGEHVTIGVTANVEGKFLEGKFLDTFLFSGAISSKAGMTAHIKSVGFKNSLVLLKKGKVSMDAKLFTEYMEWFTAELERQGLKGQHILLLDNHDSHERSAPISAAMNHGILVVTFPSHFNHVLQMLDISFFKALKSQYKAAAKYSWNVQQIRITTNRTSTSQSSSSCFEPRGLPLRIQSVPSTVGRQWVLKFALSMGKKSICARGIFPTASACTTSPRTNNMFLASNVCRNPYDRVGRPGPNHIVIVSTPTEPNEY